MGLSSKNDVQLSLTLWCIQSKLQTGTALQRDNVVIVATIFILTHGIQTRRYGFRYCRFPMAQSQKSICSFLE